MFLARDCRCQVTQIEERVPAVCKKSCKHSTVSLLYIYIYLSILPLFLNTHTLLSYVVVLFPVFFTAGKRGGQGAGPQHQHPVGTDWLLLLLLLPVGMPRHKRTVKKNTLETNRDDPFCWYRTPTDPSRPALWIICAASSTTCTTWCIIQRATDRTSKPKVMMTPIDVFDVID